MSDRYASRQHNRAKKKTVPAVNLRIFVLGIAVVMLIFVGILALSKPKEISSDGQIQQAAAESTENTRTYLSAQGISTITETEVQSVVAEIQDARKAAQKEDRLKKIESGEIDYWTLYTDGLLMGDSRFGEFAWCGFLPQDNVCAEKSNTIRNIPDYYDHIKYMNPSFIVLNYGMNDIGCGIWADVNEWCEEFATYIDKIKELAPNAKLYVLAVFPVIDPAFETSQLWYEIPEWNESVKAKCEEWGINFIDLSYLAEQYKEYYQEDGVHFYVPFYYKWAEEMIKYIDFEE